jgi:GMP synthase (glutamine-hydrolysing)
MAAGRPILGSCLGAQIMASAAGARVYRNAKVEVGYEPVTLTEAGRASALMEMAPARFMTPHWHVDAFDLPHGATRLAFSILTETQAFSIGRHALGLQFHIEADPRITGAWLVAYIGDIERAGISVKDFRSDIARHGAATAAAGMRLMARWLGELEGAGS